MPEKRIHTDPMYEYGEVFDEKTSDIAKVWDRYFPFWPLLLLLFAICMGATWLILRYQPLMYQAKASVLIKDEKKGVDDPKMTSGLNQISATKIVENEIEVITSRGILSQVVLDFHLYAPVYQEGKWIPVSSYLSSPIVIEAEYPSKIHDEQRVDFTFSKVDSLVHIGNLSYKLNEWVITNYGRLRFLPNDKFTQEYAARKYYFKLINSKTATNYLSRKLNAGSVNKLASVIALSLKDDVPERAEDILNAIIEQYSRTTMRNRNTMADSTSAFVKDRLEKVTRELDSIQKRMEAYRSEKNAMDVSTQGKLVLDNLSVNDQKVSEVEMQLAVLDQIETYVLSKTPQSEIVPSSLLVSDPLMVQKLEKLYQAESEYDKLKRTTAENNPILVSIVNQINRLKPSILESIKNQKLSLEAGRTNLNSTSNKYSELLQTMPKKERDLLEISREEMVKTNLYNFLSQKLEEARLAKSSVILDNIVIDQAEAPMEPVAPKPIFYYLLSIVVAIVAYVVLINSNEAFNLNILYRSEIEKLTSTPILVEIPFEKEKNPIVIGNGKTNFVAEQFRKLRSSLGYLGISGKRKKILITSIIPGEGKSFIAANLGMTIALAGKKVLILEFDLVNPGISNKLAMKQGKGLSAYLAGEAEPEEIIKQSTLCENLYVISAGKNLPLNPSELILNNRTAELLEYADPIFDYIIIDTPPVGLRSDAFTLSKLCDATLYVMRHKRTPKKSVRHMDEISKINELKNMAIVFNGVKPRGFTKNNYSYGYEYKYKEKTAYNKKDRINS